MQGSRAAKFQNFHNVQYSGTEHGTFVERRGTALCE